MKSKTTIVCVLLLIAAAVVVGLEKAGMFTPLIKKPAGPADCHLFIPAPKNPKRLTIENLSGKKLVFIKNDADGWEIVHPIRGRVKPSSVERIVSRLVNLQYVRRFSPLSPDGLDDVQTCLDKPRWVVNFCDDAGNAYTLFVGRQCPRIGASRGRIETYVRVKGSQKTSVVPEDLSALLCKDPEDFSREEKFKPQRNSQKISLPGSILDCTVAPATKDSK